jgi:hypothetical protein
MFWQVLFAAIGVLLRRGISVPQRARGFEAGKERVCHNKRT